jgi:hypothetical protein
LPRTLAPDSNPSAVEHKGEGAQVCLNLRVETVFYTRRGKKGVARKYLSL